MDAAAGQVGHSTETKPSVTRPDPSTFCVEELILQHHGDALKKYASSGHERNSARLAGRSEDAMRGEATHPGDSVEEV